MLGTSFQHLQEVGQSLAWRNFHDIFYFNAGMTVTMVPWLQSMPATGEILTITFCCRLGFCDPLDMGCSASQHNNVATG